MRQGVLSDYHVMKHCAYLQPIPMNMADEILHHDLNIHISSPFTTKALKYQKVVSRPASFNTLANSLTRVGGNDFRIRDHLIKNFVQEINGGNGNGNENGNGNGNGNGYSTASTNGNGNGNGSTFSDADLHRRSSTLLSDMDADLRTNPITPRPGLQALRALRQYSSRQSESPQSPSDHGSSAEFTGDELNLQNFPSLPHYAFRNPYHFHQPLVYERGEYPTHPERPATSQGYNSSDLDLLDNMARQNEELRSDPRTPRNMDEY